MAKNSSISTQALWLAIGSFSSFSLAIVSAAILARYFNKSDYGTYKQIIYIYNALFVLFAAGLPNAFTYFLPKQTMEENKDFVNKMIIILIILGTCFSLILFFSAPLIAILFKNQGITKGLRLFSIIPILMLPTLGLEGIYASIKKTYIVAIYNTATRVFMLLSITLPVILFEGTYTSAIFGWIISSTLTFLLAIYLIKKPYKQYKSGISPFKYKHIFSFSIPILLASIFGILIRFADQFFISRYFGEEKFADFSNGFIELPFVGMVTGAISVVLIPLFSGYISKKQGTIEIIENWKNAISKSALILYPILIFFIFFSNQTMLVLYGAKYEASTIFFQIGMLVNLFTIAMYNTILFSMGETKIYSWIHIVQAILIWGLGFLVIKIFNSAVVYAITSRMLFILQIAAGIYFSTKKLNVRIKDVIPFFQIGKILLHASITCTIIVILIKYLHLPLFFELVLSSIIYGILIIVTGPILKINYLDSIKFLTIGFNSKK